MSSIAILVAPTTERGHPQRLQARPAHRMTLAIGGAIDEDGACAFAPKAGLWLIGHWRYPGKHGTTCECNDCRDGESHAPGEWSSAHRGSMQEVFVSLGVYSWGSPSMILFHFLPSDFPNRFHPFAVF